MSDHKFTCPHCGKETVVESPMDVIFAKWATCEHCGREFFIKNGEATPPKQ